MATKAIRNTGNMLSINILALNKICSKLKINRFKMRHAPYSNRCGAFNQ